MAHCPACDPTPRLDGEAARIGLNVRILFARVLRRRELGLALPDSRAGSRVTSPVPGAGQLPPQPEPPSGRALSRAVADVASAAPAAGQTSGAVLATTAGVQRGGGAPESLPVSADSLRPAADL